MKFIYHALKHMQKRLDAFDHRSNSQLDDHCRVTPEDLSIFWIVHEFDRHACRIFVQSNKLFLWSKAHSPMQYLVACIRCGVPMRSRNVYSSMFPTLKFDHPAIFSVQQCTTTVWFFHIQMHQEVHNLY